MRDIVQKRLNKDKVIDSFILTGSDPFNYSFQLRHGSHSTGATIWVFPLTKDNEPFSIHWSDMKVFLFKWFAQLYFNHLKRKHKDIIMF